MSLTDVDLRDAAKVNFYVDAGNSWDTQLTLLDAANVAINIAGATVTFKIKNNLTDTGFVQNMSIGNGLSITGASSNKISISPASLIVGDYVYEIVITKVSGDVIRIKGRIAANEE